MDSMDKMDRMDSIFTLFKSYVLSVNLCVEQEHSNADGFDNKKGK